MRTFRFWAAKKAKTMASPQQFPIRADPESKKLTEYQLSRKLKRQKETVNLAKNVHSPIKMEIQQELVLTEIYIYQSESC